MRVWAFVRLPGQSAKKPKTKGIPFVSRPRRSERPGREAKKSLPHPDGTRCGLFDDEPASPGDNARCRAASTPVDLTRNMAMMHDARSDLRRNYQQPEFRAGDLPNRAHPRDHPPTDLWSTASDCSRCCSSAFLPTAPPTSPNPSHVAPFSPELFHLVAVTS